MGLLSRGRKSEKTEIGRLFILPPRIVLFSLLCSLGLLIFPSTASASLDCNYDSTSYITTTQDIKWSCWTSDFTDGKCYGIVNYQGDVLTMYPSIETVTGVGMVDYFRMQDGLVNVYFKTTDLYEGYNYTFEVLCGELYGSKMERFNVTVGLQNRDLTEVAYRGVWVKESLPMLFFVLIFIVIGLILMKMVKG